MHTVQRGDNPSNIADKYGVELDDFFAWNNLNRRSTLQIGDELVVYTDGNAPENASQAPAEPEPRELMHTVQHGDNPSNIADKYGVELEDFLDWNKLSRRSVLHIGEEYVVYLPAE